MEIKANYVLIGIFTLLGLIGALGFLLWLASVQIDRQFQIYDVYFDDVSGLSRAGEVRYNGLPVGQVLSLDLAQDVARIRVRIEIDAETPVRVGTTAQLAVQGVTGVSYVSLSGGEAGAPLLTAVSEQDIPVIPSEPSLVQTLTEQAPDLVNEAVALISELQEFAGPANQERVATLLENLGQASGALDTALSDFSSISRTVATATDQITEFTGRLDEIGAAVETTLGTIDGTLEASRSTIAEAETTLIAATGALESAESTFDLAGATIQNEVPRIADDLSSAIRSVDAAVEEAMAELSSITARFGTTADLANQRLTELETTLTTLDTTLADAQTTFDAVTEASDAVEILVEGTGASLVDEARATLQTVDGSLAILNETIARDVPQIARDVRSATAGAADVVAQAEEALASLPDRLDPLAEEGRVTLSTATETLRRAQGTLDRLDTTLAGAEGALSAAEGAFTGIGDVVGREVAPAAADIRAAAQGVETTMAALTEDLPAIAADLRETAARARNVAETVDAAAAAATPGIRAFSERGLPEFTRFAREAQNLVSSLERLVARIERDPTRFLFGTSTPEFGR